MPDKFEEKALELKNQLKKALKDDSSKEDIDATNKNCESIDELIAEHSKMKSDYQGIKDDYIKLVKNSGTSEKGADDLGNPKPIDINSQEEIEKDMRDFFKDKDKDK